MVLISPLLTNTSVLSSGSGRQVCLFWLDFYTCLGVQLAEVDLGKLWIGQLCSSPHGFSSSRNISQASSQGCSIFEKMGKESMRLLEAKAQIWHTVTSSIFYWTKIHTKASPESHGRTQPKDMDTGVGRHENYGYITT